MSCSLRETKKYIHQTDDPSPRSIPGRICSLCKLQEGQHDVSCQVEEKPAIRPGKNMDWGRMYNYFNSTLRFHRILERYGRISNNQQERHSFSHDATFSIFSISTGNQFALQTRRPKGIVLFALLHLVGSLQQGLH